MEIFQIYSIRNTNDINIIYTNINASFLSQTLPSLIFLLAKTVIISRSVIIRCSGRFIYSIDILMINVRRSISSCQQCDYFFQLPCHLSDISSHLVNFSAHLSEPIVHFSADLLHLNSEPFNHLWFFSFLDLFSMCKQVLIGENADLWAVWVVKNSIPSVSENTHLFHFFALDGFKT